MLWLAKTILYTKPKDFWLLASYWGFHLAWMSLAAQLIAGFGSSRFWSKFATYTSELSLSMSVSICILYWPFEFHNFMHDKWDTTLFTALFVHSTPFVVTILNLLLSKTIFLKKDAKYGILIQFCYMPFNYFGGIYVFHRPIYYQSPISDWSTPWVTFALSCGSAMIQFVSIYVVALITQRAHGFVEHDKKWRRELISDKKELQQKRNKQKEETADLQDKLRKIEELDLNFSEKRKLCEKLIAKTLEK